MRRGSIFWGILLVVLGILFLLQTTDLISDVFGWFWPIVLILLGIWVLTGRIATQVEINPSEQDFSIDLQTATQLALDFDHGGGSVQINGGAAAGVAISGTKAHGIEIKSKRVGERLDVDIEAGPSFIPFLGPDSGGWRFWLSEQVPLTLDVDSGASSLDFDLSLLKLTNLKVDMGASTLKLKLPTNAGYTNVEINAGAATLDFSIPPNVALLLHAKQEVSSFDIDLSRFPAQGNGLYQSADYETAANKVEITLSGGANTVKVW